MDLRGRPSSNGPTRCGRPPEGGTALSELPIKKRTPGKVYKFCRAFSSIIPSIPWGGLFSHSFSIAPMGHRETQLPHPVHFPLMKAVLPFISMAREGQMRIHILHPLHTSSLILTTISCSLPFPAQIRLFHILLSRHIALCRSFIFCRRQIRPSSAILRRYARNSGPTSSRFRASSTVACKNPALLPES